jgi:hypothetical protein
MPVRTKLCISTVTIHDAVNAAGEVRPAAIFDLMHVDMSTNRTGRLSKFLGFLHNVSR